MTSRSTRAARQLEARLNRLLSRPVLRLTQNRLRVLAYHAVDSPTGLDEQLHWLRQNFCLIHLSDLHCALDTGQPLPPRSVLVTFDDGYRSVLDVGLPVLRRYGVRPVVYLLPGHVGNSEPFWWEVVAALSPTPADEIRRLKKVPNSHREAAVDALQSAASPRLQQSQLTWEEAQELGVEVDLGNHTFTHPCLPNCREEVARRETVAAHAALADNSGQAPRSFAYPNGDFDERITHLLRESGYLSAFLFDHRLCNVDAQSPFAMSRLRVSTTTPLGRFRSIVSGVHPALHHLLRRP